MSALLCSVAVCKYLRLRLCSLERTVARIRSSRAYLECTQHRRSSSEEPASRADGTILRQLRPSPSRPSNPYSSVLLRVFTPCIRRYCLTRLARQFCPSGCLLFCVCCQILFVFTDECSSCRFGIASVCLSMMHVCPPYISQSGSLRSIQLSPDTFRSSVASVPAVPASSVFVRRPSSARPSSGARCVGASVRRSAPRRSPSVPERPGSRRAGPSRHRVTAWGRGQT